MVDKFRTILSELNTNHKPVWLLALLKMDDIVDRWSVIISAPWIKETDRNAQFSYILGLIKERLTQDEMFSIARIVFLSKDDHLVEELLKRGTGEKIDNEPVNGNTVHDGVIIESNPNLVWQETGLFVDNLS